MREYRGKRIDNGERVYGGYWERNNKCFIISRASTPLHRYLPIWYIRLVEVIPETVGQDTGLKDKNGKKIFRRDILDWDSNRFIVEWDNENGMWYGKPLMGNKEGGILAGLAFGNTVIGNKWDDKELLE